MDFHGITINGGLSFRPDILMRRRLYLESLKNGEKIVETIKKDRSTKTQKQCAAVFGVYIPILRQTMIYQGRGLFGVAPSIDFIKEILYRCCGGVGEHGESRTLSQMNIEEAGRFISNIQDFSANELGFPLPELNPNWRELVKG